jgi:hypothetical protein
MIEPTSLTERTATATVTASVTATATNRHNATSMDLLLENEKERNKTESWNKIEKADRVQKLRMFADTWSAPLSVEVRDQLFFFLHECLDKNKLKNKKDIVYDKMSMTVKSIPSLVYLDNTFTLITDSKRVSTLKSLTPRRKNE